MKPGRKAKFYAEWTAAMNNGNHERHEHETTHRPTDPPPLQLEDTTRESPVVELVETQRALIKELKDKLTRAEVT